MIQIDLPPLYNYCAIRYHTKHRSKKFLGVVNIVEQQFYLDELFRLKNNFSVKVITGIRDTGKSTLLKNFANELKARGVSEKEIIFIECATIDTLNNFQQLYNLVEEQTVGLEKFFLLVDDIDCVSDSEKAINAFFVGAIKFLRCYRRIVTC